MVAAPKRRAGLVARRRGSNQGKGVKEQSCQKEHRECPGNELPPHVGWSIKAARLGQARARRHGSQRILSLAPKAWL